MADYQPLDLSALCSAGLEVLGANAQAPMPDRTVESFDKKFI